MHWIKPQVIGWGRPNLVHNVEDKMLKSTLKVEMTRREKSQTLKLGHA
jgi:hypothetical protein